jgi:hypothetical protein
MEKVAFLIPIFIGVLVAFVASLFPIMLSGKRWKAAQEKAHMRRLVDARMNARLLRLNL